MSGQKFIKRKTINFIQNKIKRELQNIISGNEQEGAGDLIETVSGYLKGGEGTGGKIEKAKRGKEQETKALIYLIDSNNLWYHEKIDPQTKIGEGAEQKVYYKHETGTVLKANDAIFYTSWLDYLNNLKVHNYFFKNTAYQLLGFQIMDSLLYAIVEQPHVIASASVNLEEVKRFLENNGFINIRNNDFINKELGIILEDLHDENVLQNHTVFHLLTPFFILPMNFINLFNFQS